MAMAKGREPQFAVSLTVYLKLAHPVIKLLGTLMHTALLLTSSKHNSVDRQRVTLGTSGRSKQRQGQEVEHSVGAGSNPRRPKGNHSQSQKSAGDTQLTCVLGTSQKLQCFQV